jgi:hypothetical protein
MPIWKWLAALIAVAATVTAASGCGSNEIKGNLTPDQASALVTDLDDVQRAAEANDCRTARAAADRFVAAVNVLPAGAGIKLKAALRDAGTKLKILPPCEPSGATGTTGAQGNTNSSTTDSTSSTEPSSTTTPAPSVPTTPETSPSDRGAGGGGNQGSPPNNPGGGSQGGGGNSQGDGSPGGGSTGGTGGTGGTGVGSG